MLMGGFNINLLNQESKESVANFLDTMCTHGFLPCISGPTHLTPPSKTLIDNIFLSLPSKKNKNTNSNIYQRNFNNMDIACFQDHLKWINWNTCLEMELNDTNKLFDKFFTVINDLLDVCTLHSDAWTLTERN